MRAKKKRETALEVDFAGPLNTCKEAPETIFLKNFCNIRPWLSVFKTQRQCEGSNATSFNLEYASRTVNGQT